MVDYRLQSKTNAPFLPPKLRVMQRNIMILHSFVGSSPYPFILYALHIYTIRPILLYTTRPTQLYHTPYSFIPHAPPLYTIRPTHLYDIPYHLYTIHPPLYTKKIINKAAKAR